MERVAARIVRITLHWVSASKSIEAEARLFDRLFTKELPGEDGDFRKELNPHSLDVVKARVEPSLRGAKEGERFQLERQGFFVVGVVMVGFGAVVAGTVEGTVVATVVGTAVAAVEGGTAVVGEACGEVVPVDCRGR